MSGYRKTEFASCRRKLVEGTEVLRTGGGASLTASECYALLDEIAHLRDRAVCSGCGQDVDEGGACHTPDCTDGEMIPASDLPGALLESLEQHNEERTEWRFDWEALRAEAKALEAALQRLKSNVWAWEVPDDVREQVDAVLEGATWLSTD